MARWRVKARQRNVGLIQSVEPASGGSTLCIHGDPAYPLRPHFQSPFHGVTLTDLPKACNKSMREFQLNGSLVMFWILGLQEEFKDMLKRYWKNVYFMYSSSKSRVCLYAWHNYICVFPDLSPNCLWVLSIIWRMVPNKLIFRIIFYQSSVYRSNKFISFKRSLPCKSILKVLNFKIISNF